MTHSHDRLRRRFLKASSMFGVAAAFSPAAIGNAFANSKSQPTQKEDDMTQTWAVVILTSFPRAMLILSGAFGLWRAKLISNSLFAAGVTAVVLGVLGGTTWLSGGFWAPDGAYSRFVSLVLLLLWVLVVSRVLLARAPGTRAGW